MDIESVQYSPIVQTLYWYMKFAYKGFNVSEDMKYVSETKRDMPILIERETYGNLESNEQIWLIKGARGAAIIWNKKR